MIRQVRIPQCGQHLAQSFVEALEVARRTRDVVAMAEQGVEVHQVDEDETFATLRTDDLQQAIETFSCRFGMQASGRCRGPQTDP